jgi:hypothetical protein
MPVRRGSTPAFAHARTTASGSRPLAIATSSATRVSAAAASLTPLELLGNDREPLNLGVHRLQAASLSMDAVRRGCFVDLECSAAAVLLHYINPDIFYAAGSGFGTDGPDRDQGAYDATAFWPRGKR